MGKRVLITGAAGNLGGLLARRLLKDEVLLHLLVANTFACTASDTIFFYPNTLYSHMLYI